MSKSPERARLGLAAAVVLGAGSFVGAACEIPLPEQPDLALEDTSIGVPDTTFDVGDGADTSDPSDGSSADLTPPRDTDTGDEESTRVAFAAGDVIVSLERYSWRSQTPGVSSRPRDPVIVPSLRIEYGPAGADLGFDDPRPVMDQPEQNWVVVDWEQTANREPLTVWYEDPAEPERGTVRVEFSPDEDAQALRVQIVPEPTADWSVTRIEAAWADDGGPLYGTGLRLDQANGRGTQRVLFRDTDAFSPTGTNDAHVAMRWLFNPRGYGLLIDTEAPSVLDLGLANPFVIQARVDATELDMRFIMATSSDQILQRFHEIGETPQRPPTWALAPHLWDQDADAIAILDDVARMRERNLPVGAVWLPETWQSAYTDHVFNTEGFADPDAFFAELDSRGIRAVAWSSPYLGTTPDDDVAPGFGSALALFEEAADNGFLAVGPDGEPVQIAWRPGRVGGVIDPTDEAAAAWWRSRVTPALERGLRGYAVTRGDDLFVQGPNAAAFDSGDDAASAQSALGHWVAGVVDEAATAVHGDDAFVLSTTGGLGGGSAVDAIWVPTVPTVRTGSVGGVESAISAMVSLGTSGYPFASVPLGGDGPRKLTDDELVRWTAVSVYAPITEIGHGRRPWVDGYSAPALDAFTEMLRTRMRLTPYLERLADEAAATGMPVVRPLGLVFPTDATTYTIEDEYLLGPDILVAPRIDARPSRQVYLPDEAWRDWYTGQLHGRKTEITAQPLAGKVPMYVRNGALIPMRMEQAETLVSEGVTSPDTTTAAASDETLHVRGAGVPHGTLDYDDGTRLEVISSTLNLETEIRFQPGTVTDTLYLEFLGVVPSEVACGATVLEFSDNVALVPGVSGSGPGVRQLNTGTLLRLDGDTDCLVVW